MTNNTITEITHIISSSINEMLASIDALADFEQNAVRKSPAAPQATDIASVLGFTGELLKGSIVLTCDRALLDVSHPNHAMGMPVREVDICDWGGEFVNQLLGRIKSRFVASKIKFGLSTPTTMVGKNMQIRAPRNGHALEFRYGGAAGELVLHFLVVVDPALIINVDAINAYAKRSPIVQSSDPQA